MQETYKQRNMCGWEYFSYLPTQSPTDIGRWAATNTFFKSGLMFVKQNTQRCYPRM